MMKLNPLRRFFWCSFFDILRFSFDFVGSATVPTSRSELLLAILAGYTGWTASILPPAYKVSPVRKYSLHPIAELKKLHIF
jgi:hypothetical protein